jgi:putative nucleotidyltransferase with HDIG domain
MSTRTVAQASSQATPRLHAVGATAFIAVVVALGSLVLGQSIRGLWDAPNPVGWIALGVLAIVASSFALKIPGVPVYLSISDTFFITSALVFGPAPATITIAADSLVTSCRRRNSVRHMLFNVTSNAIALWSGAQTFYALSGVGPLSGTLGTPDATMMLPLACLAVVYFGLNSGLLALVVGLSKGSDPIQVWREHFAIISLNYLAAASASFFLIVLVRAVGLLGIVAVMPLILVCYLAMRSWLGRVDDAHRHVARVNQLYLSTIGALSTAIEAKDGVTSDHIHRVQAYAMGLARALKVTDQPTLEAIEAAALLHDTGKLAIPERILNKPGKLSGHEFETMKSHVDVGADILSTIDFPYPVVPIVRAHHENWDGSGYPNGLRGEEIPLGARILSVVDCFDALTSDRPYRPALSDAEALAIIARERGTKYDPGVVDMFVQVHRDIAPPPAPPLPHSLHRLRGATQSTPSERATMIRFDPSPQQAEELLAFVSLARISSQTPTVGDIGALAWGHIRHIAPGSSLAIFIHDAKQNSLVPEYTAGPAARQLAELVITMGQRLTGWVGANAESVINSDARLDLSSDAPTTTRFAISIPLVHEGSTVGVMTLYRSGPFTLDQSRTLEMIAPHLATALSAALAAPTYTSILPTPSQRRKANLRIVARRDASEAPPQTG